MKISVVALVIACALFQGAAGLKAVSVTSNIASARMAAIEAATK
ncbi:MAG: hypothetical protein WAO76_07155 [Georgfuchsia sp.]